MWFVETGAAARKTVVRSFVRLAQEATGETMESLKKFSIIVAFNNTNNKQMINE